MKLTNTILVLIALALTSCDKASSPTSAGQAAKIARLESEIERLKAQQSQKSPREIELEAEIESLKARKAQKVILVTGIYLGTGGGEYTYTATFLGGHAFRIVSPSNGQTFSGSYTIEGNTIIGDLGFGKQIYQIVDDTTLSTDWNGRAVILKKQ